MPWTLRLPWREGARRKSAGDAARDAGDWETAAKHYRVYLALDPGCFPIWVQFGHALKETGRPDEAATAYGQALAIDPANADLLLSLGHLQKLRGNLRGAVDYYRRSAAVDRNQHAVDELRRLGAPYGTIQTGRWEGRPQVIRASSATGWALPSPPVRAIAYYLPQFHPFPENDRWWGKGFTEWTNVTRGSPQFAGHYQPHRPGELGYYDLRVEAVQERQAELAQLYGLSGFCFYFYWFSGVMLMEKPIAAFADNPRIDFPFCLCWANENWTRKWDGRDSEVLIGQDYSPEDDIAFIEHVSVYLSHRNYIRVNGRPVLLVYRAELLPDPKATAARWRTRCRDIGLGDIFLVCTQSFSTFDPRDIDFDAAVEFPPNNTGIESVPTTAVSQADGFFGSLYDYKTSVELARKVRTTDYRLWRGVFTSWDNTVRRGVGSTVFINSTPSLYRQYAESVCDQLLARPEGGWDNRLLFVNAWNEWAEGAHLEPDERHGYAYLEATRMALIRSSARDGAARALRFGEAPTRPALAVIVHAFHLDVLEELLPRFADYPPQSEFFFTTPPEQEAALVAMLAELRHVHTVIVTENRGRDVAPFLETLAHIWSQRFRYVLKLHTKRSDHRSDGHVWRNQTFCAIADANQISELILRLDASPDIGIVGAAEHLVPMTTYWGSNAARVLDLAERLGVPAFDEYESSFVSGTMFIARLEALEPLMGLSLAREDFEPEAGQTDGTLAHAIERAISLSAEAASLKVCGVRGLGCELEFVGRDPNASFAFAEPTVSPIRRVKRSESRSAVDPRLRTSEG